MKTIICFIFAAFYFVPLHAQYKVTFIVKEKTAIHHDSIYVTGTFNNWDSTSNRNYLMHSLPNNEKTIVLDLKEGPMKYKFTRGTWLNVEKKEDGSEVADRAVAIMRDTTLIDSIERWRDEMLIDKWYALVNEKEDTSRIKILTDLATAYAFQTEYFNADSALFYAQTALQLQQKIMSSAHQKIEMHLGYINQLISLQEIVASLMHSLGNYPKALELRFENLKLAEKERDRFIMAQVLESISNDYVSMKDYRHVLSYGKLSDSILQNLNPADPRFPETKWNAYAAIENAFFNMQELDSALYYANKMAVIKSLPFPLGYLASANGLLADIYAEKGENKTAIGYYKLAILNSNDYWIAKVDAGLARVFQKEGHLDSALLYAKSALTFYQTQTKTVQSWGENSNYFIAEISPLVAELYKANGQLDSAYKYLHLSVVLKDSLYNTDKVRQFQTLTFNESSRRQQLEQQSKEAKQDYDNRVRMYGFISIITGMLIFAFILYRNNKQKQKANILLQAQKQEIETTLSELKNTQTQLVQSEKMASLGELTAGIAHEIQNPLNFVNNFSEVNKDLIEELNAERLKPNTERDEQLEKELLNDLKENEEKINFHGKRADAIVKGMLQHSRASKGIKEPTNINVLADEYFRLAYHGLRAKDKTFNAEMKTDFDDSIGKINIVPQDIGRVLLNLYNNGFYAVSERKKVEGEGYSPLLSLQTMKSGNNITITVKDNGNGIPQNVVGKIFQPFFTTKPTGQGTGLGLSLSYDIVKAHGGEIKVETKEGEGTAFIIQLPV